MKKLVLTRKASQMVFLGLFVYILWSTTYPLKGLFPSDAFFKIDPLTVMFTSLSERVFLPGFIISLLMLALTLVFGRFFCGWVCPLGTCLDLTAFGKKRKTVLREAAGERIRRIKYIVLGTIFLFAVLGVQCAWVFDPIVIAARFVSLNLIPWVTMGVERSMVFAIQRFDLYGPFYDLYRDLRSSFLGININMPENSGVIFASFALLLLASGRVPRLWCRTLCPLGALYSLPAKLSLLERRSEKCTRCGVCSKNCRMGAIKDTGAYNKAECVLCMDCVYDCRPGTSFNWHKAKRRDRAQAKDARGMSRKDFLLFFIIPLVAGFKNKDETAGMPDIGLIDAAVIRPPGAQNEKKFLNLCVRCGNCMKVCITGALHPVMFESGLEGLWSPRLVPELGYCEYNCNLCGQVCPTGAIPSLPLPEKKKQILGLAVVDKTICLPWVKGKDCIVCEEHCPTPDKAIKMEIDTSGIRRPIVDKTLCIGCGICQTKCPVRPQRAIRVIPTA
ncbi:MAG: 4Fe-4S binding protein [Candidatus Omnitrophica bacterium]|nr:4Fe-4S binding protein [Candidatus Omnitrophota bacterium]